MRSLAILAVVSATALSSPADTFSFEKVCLQLSADAPIVWKAPTNSLAERLWIYKRLPRVFSGRVISNAVVLASLETFGFPQPSTNDFVIWENKGPDYSGPIPSIFGIQPSRGTVSYCATNYPKASGEDIPGDEIILKRAWRSAWQFELDPKQLMQKPLFSHICPFDAEGRDNTSNQIGGRGVFLARQIDGIDFFSRMNDGDGAEGFSVEFGSHGKIRAFSLTWPKLEKQEICQIANPQQLIACIRAHKIVVVPNGNEENFFGRLKTLSKAKKLTITKMTPYYRDGIYGVEENEPPKWVTPVAVLEAIADFGDTNATLQIYSPILSSQVMRVLTK